MGEFYVTNRVPGSRFRSKRDGEYTLCPRCAAAGMGIDAWLPAVEQFWYLRRGRLEFFACRACRDMARTEVKRRGRDKKSRTRPIQPPSGGTTGGQHAIRMTA